MKFTKTKKMAVALMSFLGIKEIPVADGKVAFTEDQKAQLEEGLTKEVMENAIAAFNKEIQANTDVKGISEKIKEMLTALDLPDEAAAKEAKQKLLDNKDTPEATDTESILSALSALEGKITEKNNLIKTLLEDSEGDSPFAIINGGKNKIMLKNSATHLFGSNKAYDAFEGRNWNKFAAGLSTSATDWTESQGVNISKLNGDMELFFRENPDEITSLHRDNFGLPAHWKKKMNVVDRVTSGSIATAEISQGRKLPWLAKNKQTIQAEEGFIYPVSIDIEFVGHFLSEIEASWMAGYNKEGSQAYKMTFVRFLVAELDKRARLEDRVASIKGIFVKTPDNATKPGRFINRQNGLLYWAWKAQYVTKKYRAFNIGLPTEANIVDYVDNLIKALPLDVRNSQGLEMDLSPYWLKAYKRRTETLYGMNQDYKGYPDHPKDFPNIRFVENVDMEGSDFMFITYSNNIEILENIPKEKSMYTFEYLKRMIYIFADYKLGIRFIHIGNKTKVGDPDEFKVQTLWSNNAPIFSSDFFVPVFDDTTGEIAAPFNQLIVDEAWATDITKITGLQPGMTVKIRGNESMTVSKSVKNNTDIVIGSDFDLQSGGTLTMIVMPDGKLKQISRTTEPESVEAADVTFEDGVIDADGGNEFTLTGSSAVAITEIVNGVPSQIIKIIGNGEANVTLSTTGNIKVTTSATLAAAGDYVELVLSDGIWTEFNREIAA